MEEILEIGSVSKNMESVDNYYNKMTKTKVSRLVILLGIPTTISMLITSIYNLVDTYFIGTIGDSAQASTGILYTLQCIIQAFAFMLGHGSGVHVSKKLAYKDAKGASLYASTAFFVGTIVGLTVMVFGLIFLKEFMIFLGSTKTILPYAKDYGMWILIAAPLQIGSLVLNNVLRYEGQASKSMLGLASGAILNILGDYIFVSELKLGVFGAGMSTGISQAISFIILLTMSLLFGRSRVGIKHISRNANIYIDIVKAGLPSLIRQGLASISSGLLNNFTKPFGDAAIAAMSVVNKYIMFVTCVALGIGQGFQPVAAFNHACGEYKRVKNGLIFTIFFSTCVVLVFTIVGLTLPSYIIRAFNKSSEVVRLGKIALRAASIGALFTPLATGANMLYQSIRMSAIASFLALLRSGIIFIPLLFIFHLINIGFKGIYLTQPISDFLSSVIGLPFILYYLMKYPNKSTYENNSV